MSKYKLLFKITGSIAAYKSAYLISKLVQNGFEVQTVASESALKFVGPATLEGLTGKPVMTDSFEQGKMMSHINLVKWTDLTITCPASANTINKFANGIGDNLVSSLFLAHDWKKPYIIAPAMNTAMFDHPATKESLSKLEKWGVKILPTDDGHLACGDYGKGKMLDPDKIYEYVRSTLEQQGEQKKLSVLITAGGTKEDIDGIRYLTNLSTGRTAAAIAQHFIDKGHNVTFLATPDVQKLTGKFEEQQFTNFKTLDKSLKQLLGSNHYDCVIHNAAVSDYYAYEIENDDEKFKLPLNNKLSSKSETMTVRFKRNPKIVESIKSRSINKNLMLVSFKFTNDKNDAEKVEQAKSLLQSSDSDVVVLNDFSDRMNGNVQQNFVLFSKTGNETNVETASSLAEEIEKLLNVIISNEGEAK